MSYCYNTISMDKSFCQNYCGIKILFRILMSVIEIKNLIKDYGKECGFFYVNLNIEKAKWLVLLARMVLAKTTTIRQIIGF